MKTARKLTSLLLALLLVFALAATAAADGADAGTTNNPGSITVDNPKENTNYTAYKIFDVVYDDAQNPQRYSYTIKGDSEWYGTVDTYAKEKTHGLTLTPVADTTANTYVVTIDDTNGTNKFSAPSFAAALDDALTTVNPTTDVHQLQDQGEEKVASGLPLGYYFVKSSENKALCNLTTTDPTATIHDKNNVPFEKTVEKNDFNVGDTVTFTITGKVPDYTGFATYTYEITDKMTDGLTFKKGTLKVNIGGQDVTVGNDTYTLTDPGESDNFTFKLTIKVKNYKVGDNIVVTYDATVNDQAIAKISNNHAVLKYSNNPNTEELGESVPKKVKVYNSKIEIVKYQTGDESKKLPGATFVLYKRGAETDTKQDGVDYDTVTANGTTKYYPRNYYRYIEATPIEGAKVQWVTDKNQANTETTDNNGAASFKGLANGTYYLLETKAPAGYNQMTEAKDVQVNGGDTEAQLSVKAEVANSTGAVLPSTGGMGTTVFYVLGAVLVLGAGVLLVTKKRMSRSEG